MGHKDIMTCLLLIFWADIPSRSVLLSTEAHYYEAIQKCPVYIFQPHCVLLMYYMMFLTSQMHKLDKNCTAFTSPPPNTLFKHCTQLMDYELGHELFFTLTSIKKKKGSFVKGVTCLFPLEPLCILLRYSVICHNFDSKTNEK